MSKLNIYLKKILTKSIIEIVAVFIGITLAFFLDNYKSENKKLELTKKYYSLLQQELEKDSAFMNISRENMKYQIDCIDSIFESFQSTEIETTNRLIQTIDEEINYDTKTEIVNTILSSSAFDDIYDTLIFSNLNNMRSWQNRYNEIDDLVTLEKNKLNEKYFNTIKDFKSNSYNSTLILNPNVFLIELSRYKKLLDERYLHVSTLIDCREVILNELKKHY